MPKAYGLVNVALPSVTADSKYVEQRLWKYGEVVSYPTLARTSHAAAGSYFKATNPTWGTGITQTQSSSFASTQPQLVWHNRGISGESIYPDYIRAMEASNGGSSGAHRAALYTDSGPRYTSGGTALIPQSASSWSFSPSNSHIVVGNITIVAVTGDFRLMSQFSWGAGTSSTGLNHFITFGGYRSANGQQAPAANQNFHHVAPPIVIGPGATMMLYFYNENSAFGTYEYEIGWVER